MVKSVIFIALLLPCIKSTSEVMSDQEINIQFAKNSAKVSNDLLQAILQSDSSKNVIFSPFSVQLCVGLAYIGATGETAKQMATGLSLVKNDRLAVAQSFKNIMKLYSSTSSLIKIANKIYVKNGYGIKAQFNQIATESYNSAAEEIDFEANDVAAAKINGWVEEQTNNKIKDLISPNDLDDLTRMILVNAIYFKGPWQNQFKKDSTKQEDFYLNESDSVKVEMMNGKAKYNYGYFDDLGFSAIEMPYEDSNISMLVLLPHSRTGLKDLVQKLNSVDLFELTNKMSVEEVIVKFPKFKVEFSIELNEPLEKLGMERMFSNEAEFDDLLSSPEPLKVSKVIHKAFIEVNEEGTEAAAATACVMRQKRSLHIPKRIEFIADHPLIFALVAGNSTKTSVLFYGSFVYPESLNKITHDEF